jgi:hypothetical protein
MSGATLGAVSATNISRLLCRKQLLEGHFDSVAQIEDWNPRYNIAPTQRVPVVRQNAKKPVPELSLFRMRTRQPRIDSQYPRRYPCGQRLPHGVAHWAEAGAPEPNLLTSFPMSRTTPIYVGFVDHKSFCRLVAGLAVGGHIQSITRANTSQARIVEVTKTEAREWRA